MTNTDKSNEHAIDWQASEAFAQKAITDIMGFGIVGMCIIGERLGLFKDLALIAFEKMDATSDITRTCEKLLAL